MNDTVNKSVENTASQDNAGVNEVSETTSPENKVFTAEQLEQIVQRDRKSTRLNSSHVSESRMPSSA